MIKNAVIRTTIAGCLLAMPMTSMANGVPEQDLMTLQVGDFSKDYEVKVPAPHADIKIFYVYDFIDNIDLIQASAEVLARKIVEAGWNQDLGMIVVPGDKANSIGATLTQALRETNPAVKLAVLRSSAKGGSALKVSYQSITHPKPKELHIRPDQLAEISGKKVIIVDDVISTGATARATKEIVEQAGGTVVGFACVATEGVKDPGDESTFEGLPMIRVTHFPVIPLKE